MKILKVVEKLFMKIGLKNQNFPRILIIIFLMTFMRNARNLGAYGGKKILGAGGRGYLLLVAPISVIPKIKKKYSKLKPLEFNFDYEGSKLIYSA